MGSPFSEGGLGGAGVNDYSGVQRGTSVLEESSRGNKLGSCLGHTESVRLSVWMVTSSQDTAVTSKKPLLERMAICRVKNFKLFHS